MSGSDKSSSESLASEDSGTVLNQGRFAISIGDGPRIAVPECGLLLGRSNGCDLVLEDGDSSRRHATVRPLGGALWLLDEGSTNGTLIDGEAVTRRRVRPGTSLLIGTTVVHVHEGEGGPPPGLQESWERFVRAARGGALESVEALRSLAAAEDCRADSDGVVAINWAEGERGLDALGPMRRGYVQRALGILAGIDEPGS